MRSSFAPNRRAVIRHFSIPSQVLSAENMWIQCSRLRQCKYLNNVIEQDHRTVKKRVWLAKGYGSFQSAWRTLQDIETVNMIQKGRVRAGQRKYGRPRSLHRRAVRTLCLTQIHA